MNDRSVENKPTDSVLPVAIDPAERERRARAVIAWLEQSLSPASKLQLSRQVLASAVADETSSSAGGERASAVSYPLEILDQAGHDGHHREAERSQR